MAAITRIQTAVNNTGTNYTNVPIVTFANAVGVNNATIVVIADSRGSADGDRVSTVVDDVGNSYTRDAYRNSATGINAQLYVYRSNNPTGGAKKITVTLGSGFFDNISIVAAEYSGIVTTSMLDQSNFNADTDYVVTHSTGFYGTLAQANELVVAAYASTNAGASYSIGNNFTTPINQANTGLYLSMAYSDKVVGVTTSANAQFASDLYTKGVGAILTYKGSDTTITNPVPPPPTKLMASTDSNRAYLSWDAAKQQTVGGFVTDTGITSFTLKRSTTSGSGYTNVYSGGTNTFYDDTGVTTGTTYYYVVTATSNGGTSANSVELVVTPSASVTTKTDSWYSYGFAPTGVTQSTIRGWMRDHWDKNVTYMFTQTGAQLGGWGGWRVQVPDQAFYNNTTNGTVSEGIGYGMIGAVYMSNKNNPKYDIKALSYFNGFFIYYKQYVNSRGLMNWDIRPDGTLADYNGATDGDLDICFALFMMHRLIGSNGPINYYAEGVALANAIDQYEYLPDSDQFGVGTANLITNGDGWNMAVDNLVAPDYNRYCYYDIFGYHTGNTTRWNKIKAKNIDFLKTKFTNIYSTGLVPDACNRNGVATNLYNWGQFKYSYNSIRMTWGFTLDYLWNGTTDIYNNQKEMADTVVSKNGGTQSAVNGGLNAGPLPLDWSSDAGYKNQCFVSGYGSVCTVQSSTTQMAGTVATWTHNNGVTENSYFGLWQGYMNLLLMSGEFTPTFGAIPPNPTGGTGGNTGGTTSTLYPSALLIGK